MSVSQFLRTPYKQVEISQEPTKRLRGIPLEVFPPFKPNETSIKLMEARKLTKLKGIFDLLDSDNDGLISGARMEVDRLPDMAYEILKPVLLEIADTEREVNFEGFIGECGRLMKKLTVTERANIMGSSKKVS